MKNAFTDYSEAPIVNNNDSDMIIAYQDNGVNPGNTRYITPFAVTQSGSGLSNFDPSDPANVQQFNAWISPGAGTIKNLSIWLSNDLGVGGLITYTLMKNGIAGPLSASGRGGATGNPVLIQDLTNTINVSLGDLLSIQVINDPASGTNATASISMIFTAI